MIGAVGSVSCNPVGVPSRSSASRLEGTMAMIGLLIRRRQVLIFVGVLLAMLLILPGVGWASHQFSDVSDSNVFHDDIQCMANTGITKGCNPQTNDEFCPKDSVTREQMAAFIHRLSTHLTSAHGVTGGIIDDFFHAGLAPILSDNVGAPYAGFFHITTVVYAGDDSTMANAGGLGLDVSVDGDSVTPVALAWFKECASNGSDCGDATITMTAVVPVAAGQHTIDLNAIENGYGSYIRGSSISTLFTPFGGA
jgi:hypothetical protein